MAAEFLTGNDARLEWTGPSNAAVTGPNGFFWTATIQRPAVPFRPFGAAMPVLVDSGVTQGRATVLIYQDGQAALAGFGLVPVGEAIALTLRSTASEENYNGGARVVSMKVVAGSEDPSSKQVVQYDLLLGYTSTAQTAGEVWTQAAT